MVFFGSLRSEVLQREYLSSPTFACGTGMDEPEMLLKINAFNRECGNYLQNESAEIIGLREIAIPRNARKKFFGNT